MDNSDYAKLPGELIYEVLKDVDEVVEKANSLLNIDEQQIDSFRNQLENKGLICHLAKNETALKPVIAVDGGSVLDRLTAADLLVAVAVGVTGIALDKEKESWDGEHQYLSWHTMISHEEYNTRLLQGIMHLMEMHILGTVRGEDIMIMDGTHFTPIIKINSLLSAQSENLDVPINPEYCSALKNFLNSKFNQDISDMPGILGQVFTNPKIISITKYTSSKDFIKGVAHFEQQTNLDDKSLCSIVLQENEYTKPQTVGQSKEENPRWQNIHINCNIGVDNQGVLNQDFKKIMHPISTKDGKKSDLYYLYFKPVSEIAYRIEVKKELAENQAELENVLRSIKKQIAFPFVIEPVPQFIADLMAKHVAQTTGAIKESVIHSDKLKINKKYLHLLTSYRS